MKQEDVDRHWASQVMKRELGKIHGPLGFEYLRQEMDQGEKSPLTSLYDVNVEGLKKAAEIYGKEKFQAVADSYRMGLLLQEVALKSQEFGYQRGLGKGATENIDPDNRIRNTLSYRLDDLIEISRRYPGLLKLQVAALLEEEELEDFKRKFASSAGADGRGADTETELEFLMRVFRGRGGDATNEGDVRLGREGANTGQPSQEDKDAWAKNIAGGLSRFTETSVDLIGGTFVQWKNAISTGSVKEGDKAAAAFIDRNRRWMNENSFISEWGGSALGTDEQLSQTSDFGLIRNLHPATHVLATADGIIEGGMKGAEWAYDQDLRSRMGMSEKEYEKFLEDHPGFAKAKHRGVEAGILVGALLVSPQTAARRLAFSLGFATLGSMGSELSEKDPQFGRFMDKTWDSTVHMAVMTALAPPTAGAFTRTAQSARALEMGYFMTGAFVGAPERIEQWEKAASENGEWYNWVGAAASTAGDALLFMPHGKGKEAPSAAGEANRGAGKNHYEILGLKSLSAASKEAIKQARDRAAKATRPDKIKDDPALSPEGNQARSAEANFRMVEINEAYKVLSNPERRAQFDAEKRGAGTGVENAAPTASGASNKPFWEMPVSEVGKAVKEFSSQLVDRVKSFFAKNEKEMPDAAQAAGHDGTSPVVRHPEAETRHPERSEGSLPAKSEKGSSAETAKKFEEQKDALSAQAATLQEESLAKRGLTRPVPAPISPRVGIAAGVMGMDRGAEPNSSSSQPTQKAGNRFLPGTRVEILSEKEILSGLPEKMRRDLERRHDGRGMPELVEPEKRSYENPADGQKLSEVEELLNNPNGAFMILDTPKRVRAEGNVRGKLERVKTKEGRDGIRIQYESLDGKEVFGEVVIPLARGPKGEPVLGTETRFMPPRNHTPLIPAAKNEISLQELFPADRAIPNSPVAIDDVTILKDAGKGERETQEGDQKTKIIEIDKPLILLPKENTPSRVSSVSRKKLPDAAQAAEHDGKKVLQKNDADAEALDALLEDLEGWKRIARMRRELDALDERLAEIAQTPPGKGSEGINTNPGVSEIPSPLVGEGQGEGRKEATPKTSPGSLDDLPTDRIDRTQLFKNEVKDSDGHPLKEGELYLLRFETIDGHKGERIVEPKIWVGKDGSENVRVVLDAGNVVGSGLRFENGTLVGERSLIDGERVRQAEYIPLKGNGTSSSSPSRGEMPDAADAKDFDAVLSDAKGLAIARKELDALDKGRAEIAKEKASQKEKEGFGDLPSLNLKDINIRELLADAWNLAKGNGKEAEPSTSTSSPGGEAKSLSSPAPIGRVGDLPLSGMNNGWIEVPPSQPQESVKVAAKSQTLTRLQVREGALFDQLLEGSRLQLRKGEGESSGIRSDEPRVDKSRELTVEAFGEHLRQVIQGPEVQEALKSANGELALFARLIQKWSTLAPEEITKAFLRTLRARPHLLTHQYSKFLLEASSRLRSGIFKNLPLSPADTTLRLDGGGKLSDAERVRLAKEIVEGRGEEWKPEMGEALLREHHSHNPPYTPESRHDIIRNLRESGYSAGAAKEAVRQMLAGKGNGSWRWEQKRLWKERYDQQADLEQNHLPES